MRVFVLALTVALVASSQISFEFVPGKIYEYEYETELMGGLPEEGLARAGVKVHSRVQISKDATPQTFILKLVDPKIFEYSGIWPKDRFTPATQLTSALAAQLMTPIKFEYASGAVRKVLAPAGVSSTVLNIYRGILNIFQLNIKNTLNVYELQEAGVHGMCKTHYVLRQDQKAERIFLSKSKDLNQCQSKIFKDMGMSHLEKCSGKAMKTASGINYIMKETPIGTQIMEAIVTELIEYSPFNILKGAAQMESKQNLTFLEVKSGHVEPLRVDYLHRGDLQYEFGSELLQSPIQLLRISNVEAQMVETLNHLVTYNVAKVHEDAPLKFIEFIQLLRVAKPENIEDLWQRFKTRPDHRHWILNAFPAMGTHFALKFLKEKFFADELTVFEAASSLMMSLHSVPVDEASMKLAEASRWRRLSGTSAAR
ncbi:vitellogenin-2-like [Stegastes partitus]|uniref:Vitellogenin-2-like n=1 Tax=Stegastes partitus TaxID=144197 RepID=A0A9Y4KEL1_9TELE|nr:PREDICTED: vitellogenin-2-like [Stegastes partitus]